MSYGFEIHHVTGAARRARTTTPTLLHHCFEAQAESTPYRTALQDTDSALSYLEVDRRANQVANYLIGEGLQPGDVVALHMERSIDLVISLLGVLKAGGAYLPIDTGLSADRISQLCADWAPKLIVTGAAVADRLPQSQVRQINVEDFGGLLEHLSANAPAFGLQGLTPETVSHVNFKAAGDGAAEAVAVDHREAIGFLRSVTALYGLDEHHRCFQDAGLALDVALEEMLAMLSVGALVVLDSRSSGGSEAIAEVMEHHRITLFSTVPQRLSELAEPTSGLQSLVVGGTPCGSDLSVSWALRVHRFVGLKRSADRFPSFVIQQETSATLRPRLLAARPSERRVA